MNRIPGLPGGTVPLTILVLLLAAPARAYGIDGDAGRSDDTWSDCRIVASVIGGAAGGLLGSALGAALERAVYGGNPDAGLTGGLVGMVVGGVAGVGLARKACGQSPENQLRAHLSLMREHDLNRTESMHKRGAGPLALLSLSLVSCHTDQAPLPESPDLRQVFVERSRVVLDDTPEATIGHVTDILPLDDRILVTDRMSDRVLALDLDGRFMAATGRAGDAPGEFRRPSWLLEDEDGSILVADRHQRLTRLSRELELVEVYGVDVPNFVDGIDRLDDRIIIQQWASRVAGDNFAIWDPETGIGRSFDPRSELVLEVPYWNSRWASRIAVSPSAVFIGDNMVYPIRRYSRQLELIDSVGSPPPSWRQARRPDLGEFAIGADGMYRKSPQEWLRSFTVIDRLVVVGGDWLVVTHRDEINEYRSDDRFSADLYRIERDLPKRWADVQLPGPVLHGGECAWTLVDGPPGPWAIACLVPMDPAGR